MANRAERRAAAKRKRRGQDLPQEGTARSRAGLLDEQSLQERSVRLQSKSKGAWKPSSSVIEQEDEDFEVIPSADPKVRAASELKKAEKKERKARLREQRQLENELIEREEELAKNAKHPAFARSPRWWATLAMWVLSAASIIAMIVMAVLKAPGWSYAIPVVVLVIALIVLAVIARTEPLNYYEQMAQMDRMNDIREAQNAGKTRVQAHNLVWWLRLVDWMLIVASGCAFVSLLFWTPSTVWVIAGIAIAFAVGVLSLFILARPSSENPHLDQYGTAI